LRTQDVDDVANAAVVPEHRAKDSLLGLGGLGGESVAQLSIRRHESPPCERSWASVPFLPLAASLRGATPPAAALLLLPAHLDDRDLHNGLDLETQVQLDLQDPQPLEL